MQTKPHTEYETKMMGRKRLCGLSPWELPTLSTILRCATHHPNGEVDDDDDDEEDDDKSHFAAEDSDRVTKCSMWDPPPQWRSSCWWCCRVWGPPLPHPPPLACWTRSAIGPSSPLCCVQSSVGSSAGSHPHNLHSTYTECHHTLVSERERERQTDRQTRQTAGFHPHNSISQKSVSNFKCSTV